MKFLIKNINIGLFIYFIILVMWLLFVSGNKETMTFYFVILKDIGNVLGAIVVTFLVYIFSKKNNETKKFIILKKIYQAMLIIIIMNFSKTIAGILIDLMQVVQITFFSNNAIINKIINKMR